MSLVAGLQPPICNADGAVFVKGAVPAGGCMSFVATGGMQCSHVTVEARILFWG